MDILNSLNFNVWTFLWQVLNLLVVIGILYKLLFKPVGQVLADREKKIESSIADAVKNKEEAASLQVKYQTMLQEAKGEAQDLVNRATKLGDEMKAEIIASARAEATNTIEKAKAEIVGEKVKALTEIRDEVTTLVVMAAGKVIGKSITAEDHERMIKEFVTEVGEVQ
ncbi:MAG: F0F1 ATP synthase subunit B [Bacillota bacterium]